MKNQEEEEEEESTSRWRRQRARATVEGVEHDATTVGVCFCCVCVCLDSCDVLYVYFVVGGLRWGGGVLFCCVDMWGCRVMWWRCGVVLHSSAAADCCCCWLFRIFLHAALWPPAFQCTRWHAAPQYDTLLHLLHRSSCTSPVAAAVFPQLAQRESELVLGIGGVEVLGAADDAGADGAGAAADAFCLGCGLRFCFGSR